MLSEHTLDQLRALRIFSRVVSEGSFAAAARAMDLTPAAVTREPIFPGDPRWKP